MEGSERCSDDIVVRLWGVEVRVCPEVLLHTPLFPKSNSNALKRLKFAVYFNWRL